MRHPPQDAVKPSPFAPFARLRSGGDFLKQAADTHGADLIGGGVAADPRSNTQSAPFNAGLRAQPEGNHGVAPSAPKAKRLPGSTGIPKRVIRPLPRTAQRHHIRRIRGGRCRQDQHQFRDRLRADNFLQRRLTMRADACLHQLRLQRRQPRHHRRDGFRLPFRGRITCPITWWLVRIRLALLIFGATRASAPPCYPLHWP